MRREPLPTPARRGAADGRAAAALVAIAAWCSGCGGSSRRRSTSSAARIPASTSTRAIQIAQRGTFVYRRPGRRVGAGVRARSVLPVASARRLLQRALHGVLHQESRYRRRHRTVSASVSRVDRDRLRARRPDRRAARRSASGRSSACSRCISRPRALFGRTAAAAAAALLALNVIEVWFARYPNAEVVMQALLFAALLATARAHVDGDPFFAPVAGALLGLLLFLRFDAVLAHRRRRRRPGARRDSTGASAARGRSWSRSLAGVALAAVYLLGPMRAYCACRSCSSAICASWQYARARVLVARWRWRCSCWRAASAALPRARPRSRRRI